MTRWPDRTVRVRYREKEAVVGHIWRDLRWAGRSVRRGGSVSVMAVLAFGLGIGVTTAVFSLFYGVLMRPLPYPDPDEIVLVYDTQPALSTAPASFPKYVDWRDRNRVFAVMGGSAPGLMVVTGAGDPERVPTVRATASLMDVFRVQPALGRWFTPEEDTPGGPNVVVLSDRFWTTHFNRDPGALGRTLTVDGVPRQIVGVMPADFSHRNGELFVPVAMAVDPAARGSHFLLTYARLKKGVTVAEAKAEMIDLGAVLAKEYGYNHGIDVQPYFDRIVGNVRQPLMMLLGAVSFVLLIACANVANLLLASGLARRRELAVRAAVGATGWDLARQMIIESVALAVVGGVLGVLLAKWALSAYIALAGGILPRSSTVAIDGAVLGFAGVMSLATGIACGLWPVLRLRARSLAGAVREGDLRSGGSAGARRFGNGLVVVEIALAFALLVGAGLFAKNLLRLEGRDAGFSTDRVVTFDVAPVGARYQADEPVGAFYRRLVDGLRAIPGVETVGLTSHLPMYDFGWNGEVSIEGGNPWPPNSAPLVEFRWVGADYFKSLGIVVSRGRAFGDGDREGTTLVTMINRRTADKLWPGENPIGRHMRKGGGGPWLEVVGVVNDVRSYGLDRPAPYEMYTPIEQSQFGAMTVVVRTRTAEASGVVPAARAAVKAIDPLVPVSHVQAMADVVGKSVNQPRLMSSLTVLFGALASVLAAVGVYGVMAYNVRRDRRDFGVRLALGASPGGVRRLVVVRGLVLGVLGVAIGAVGALLLTRTVQAMLSDVAPTDPWVFTATAVLLIAVSVVSCDVPARQASRTDPIVALRAE
jgi:putative ABC transport system permease protein